MVVAYAVGSVLAVASVALAVPVLRAGWASRVERRNREIASAGSSDAPVEASALDRRLSAAGLQVPAGVFAGMAVALAFACAAAGFSRFGLPGAAAGAALAAGAGELWLRSRIGARKGRFEVQLGECLPMVAEGIRGGMTFERSVRNVASYMDEPIKGQFDIFAAERALGISLGESIERMARRVNSRDMDMLAAVVAVQSQAGGSMADVLDSIAATIQRRNRLRKHVEVVTADGRISAAIIGAVPVVVFIVLNVAAPTYVQLLTASVAGWALLATAGAMVLAGLAVIRRLYRIKIY